MVKRRVLDPCPVFDEALLLEALKEEGIKDVSSIYCNFGYDSKVASAVS